MVFARESTGQTIGNREEAPVRLQAVPFRQRLLNIEDSFGKVKKTFGCKYEGEEKSVLRIGILCSRNQEREEIIRSIERLTAREGFEYSICSILQEETAEWENIACVILAWEDRDHVFRYAEKLWDREQALLIIYVAYKVEDIIAALGMPFFHIVRSFSLEQDLEVAFRKLDRVRVTAADKIKFSVSGQLMLIPTREILYLESEGHEIRLHSETGMYLVKENLSQCEGRLKRKGFVRIYTSFLVNMYHIRCLEKDKVWLDNGEHLYVSRRKYPEVKLLFENYIRHLDFM